MHEKAQLWIFNFHIGLFAIQPTFFCFFLGFSKRIIYAAELLCLLPRCIKKLNK